MCVVEVGRVCVWWRWVGCVWWRWVGWGWAGELHCKQYCNKFCTLERAYRCTIPHWSQEITVSIPRSGSTSSHLWTVTILSSGTSALPASLLLFLVVWLQCPPSFTATILRSGSSTLPPQLLLFLVVAPAPSAATIPSSGFSTFPHLTVFTTSRPALSFTWSTTGFLQLEYSMRSLTGHL